MLVTWGRLCDPQSSSPFSNLVEYVNLYVSPVHRAGRSRPPPPRKVAHGYRCREAAASRVVRAGSPFARIAERNGAGAADLPADRGRDPRRDREVAALTTSRASSSHR